MPDMRISGACRDARPDGESMRPDYCPVANEPCQSMCETPCNRKELIAIRKDAENYRKLRNGSNWPAVFASHDAPEPLRGEELDKAMQKGQS